MTDDLCGCSSSSSEGDGSDDVTAQSSGVDAGLSMFDITDAEKLAKERLVSVAQSYLGGQTIDASYLLMKLQAEEELAEAEFNTFFTPRQVYAQGIGMDKLAAMNPNNYPLVVEPGYDYEPSMLSGDSWGFMQLRHNHIINVDAIRFVWPDTKDDRWNIPVNWVRSDSKYGRINIIPVQTPVELPLDIFVMGALSGGRRVPFMLQVIYKSGLVNAKKNFPLLVDYIMKKAAISIVEDQFLPQSGSISGDGLSQSMSLDTSKFRDQLEPRRKQLDRLLNGVRLAFA